MKKTISPLVLAFALAASGAIAAEDIYRSTMPDGSIRYGESPAPGAKQVKKVPSPPQSTGVTVVTPEEKSRTYATPQGGTAVLPQQPRKATESAEQGRLQGPPGLPPRAY